ncbi:MAG: hypothetical protein JKY65_26070 [Planctomycetes bacterium]|nr:hypothetical protein [Planctomycetota bacterium]
MDPRLSELRLVEWELEGASEPRRELVPSDDVDQLCAAIKALHFEPGVNPHNGEPAARLVRLSVGEGGLEAGYWWTAPTLQDSGDRARLVRWRLVTRFEAKPEVDPVDPV